MGGLAGHMMHPYEDTSLTFGQIKQMVIDIHAGNIPTPTEKVDGQNTMFSWVNGELRFARNKSQVKNFGEAAMNLQKIKYKFTNTDVSTVFSLAYTDLLNVLSLIDSQKLADWFDNGKYWVNCEIINSNTRNIIPYDSDMIIFHNIKEYDIHGDLVGIVEECESIVTELVYEINESQKGLQITHDIMGPNELTINFNKWSASTKQELIDDISSLQSEFNSSDKNTLGHYQERWYTKVLKQRIPLPSELKRNILNRWVYNDKAFRLNSKNIANAYLLQQLKYIESDELKGLTEILITPFEIFFLKLGQYAISLYSDRLLSNHDSHTNQILDEFNQAYSALYNSDELIKLRLLSKNLNKIQKLGGVGNMIPTEGIVFEYNDKFYKLTSIFSPVHKIISKVTFG